jgi:hypothetical protein
MLYGRNIAKPVAPTISAQSENDEDLLKKEIAEILQNAKGCGYKASVGSREVRAEFVSWYEDTDAANGMLKKWREKDWVQDEEKDPPKFLKAIANKSGGGKAALNIVRDGLGFRQNGETFTIRTSMDVNLVKNGLGSIVAAVNPSGAGGGGPGGGPRPPVIPGGGGPQPGGVPRRRRLGSALTVPR